MCPAPDVGVERGFAYDTPPNPPTDADKLRDRMLKDDRNEHDARNKHKELTR